MVDIKYYYNWNDLERLYVDGMPYEPEMTRTGALHKGANSPCGLAKTVEVDYAAEVDIKSISDSEAPVLYYNTKHSYAKPDKYTSRNSLKRNYMSYDAAGYRLYNWEHANQKIYSLRMAFVGYTYSDSEYKNVYQEKITKLLLPDLVDNYVTDLSFMFQNVENVNYIDVSGWDTSNVVTLRGMFNKAGYQNNYINNKVPPGFRIKGIEDWDVRNVRDMDLLFSECGYMEKLDLSKWKTDSLGGVYEGIDEVGTISVDGSQGSRIFLNCQAEEINISGWDFSQMQTMKMMFGYGSSTSKKLRTLKKLIMQDVIYPTGGGISYQYFLEYAENLEYLDIPTLEIDESNNYSGFFSNSDSLRYVRCTNSFKNKFFSPGSIICHWDVVDNPSNSYNPDFIPPANITVYGTTKVANGTVTLEINGDTVNIETNEQGYLQYVAPTNLHSIIIPYDSQITSINLDRIDSSNITTIYLTDASSSGNGRINRTLKRIKANLIDTSQVTNLNGLCVNLWNLEELEIGSWDTSNVTTMYGAFREVHSLKVLDLHNWSNENVTNMSYMFYNCHAEYIDISGFDVPTQPCLTTNMCVWSISTGARPTVKCKRAFKEWLEETGVINNYNRPTFELVD